MTIATGFVVDDAIVMVENVTRYLEQGYPPLQAALKGSKEIGFTIISISLSLIAVFIPVLLMGGIIGRLFREFAVTVSIAILMSDHHLADADADDVRATAAGPESAAARPALSPERALLRRHAGGLRSQACAGCCAIARSRLRRRSQPSS